ncbi:MAG: hypothetical protein HWE07_14070 [Cytophagia bacterium]|nr:hypothetical protein [Cytophagia bacterium]
MKEYKVRSVVLNTIQYLEADNSKINDVEVRRVINEMVAEGFELKSVVPLANSHVNYESDDLEKDVDGLVHS